MTTDDAEGNARHTDPRRRRARHRRGRGGRAIEFLVAEFPGHEVHGDSYVLLLEHPAESTMRAADREGSRGGRDDRRVRIAAGPDGRNRDVLAPGDRLVVAPDAFEGFADAAIELCDGWPGYVEQDVEGWIANTNGTICFWTYTVVQELPEPGVPVGVVIGAAALEIIRRLSTQEKRIFRWCGNFAPLEIGQLRRTGLTPEHAVAVGMSGPNAAITWRCRTGCSAVELVHRLQVRRRGVEHGARELRWRGRAARGGPAPRSGRAG